MKHTRGRQYVKLWRGSLRRRLWLHYLRHPWDFRPRRIVAAIVARAGS